MNTPATRLITLIMLLQRRPNQKAADLAEKLGVSVRTLHRYFGMLDEMGIPVFAERGPYGGFSLVRGYKLPPLVFTPEEAVSVYLGASLVGEMWGELYQDAAQGAVAKLDNVLPDAQRAEVAWAQRSLVVRELHRADPTALAPLLEKIRRGARLHRQVEMHYQGSTKAEVTQRCVDPYALVHQTGWWYLVGYCHLREAMRTFRVDRIQDLVLLDESFKRAEDFDVHAYLENAFKGQPVIRARLRFVPEAAHMARASHSSCEVFEENPDGSVDVVATAPDLYWLASLVLSFASWIKVLDPPELQEMVRDWALGTAALYEKT
jgi:predicted DNA-binding transcriptional regulator YafY